MAANTVAAIYATGATVAAVCDRRVGAHRAPLQRGIVSIFCHPNKLSANSEAPDSGKLRCEQFAQSLGSLHGRLAGGTLTDQGHGRAIERQMG